MEVSKCQVCEERKTKKSSFWTKTFVSLFVFWVVSIVLFGTQAFAIITVVVLILLWTIATLKYFEII